MVVKALEVEDKLVEVEKEEVEGGGTRASVDANVRWPVLPLEETLCVDTRRFHPTSYVR